MEKLPKSLATVLMAATFGLWLFIRGLPEFTGLPRIAFNLVVAVVAIWWIAMIWSASAWKPEPPTGEDEERA